MARIPPLKDDQVNAKTHAVFDKLQAAFKTVPNIFRTLAHVPEVLQATLSLNQAIQGDLDPKLRELAYLKASQVNNCKYCLHYHTGAARKVGVSDVQVQTLEDYEQSIAYSDLEKLVIRFAEQWSQQGKVDTDVVAALSKQLSPSQLVILAATCGLANWTNRFNETFGVALP